MIYCVEEATHLDTKKREIFLRPSSGATRGRRYITRDDLVKGDFSAN